MGVYACVRGGLTVMEANWVLSRGAFQPLSVTFPGKGHSFGARQEDEH